MENGSINKAEVFHTKALEHGLSKQNNDGVYAFPVVETNFVILKVTP